MAKLKNGLGSRLYDHHLGNNVEGSSSGVCYSLLFSVFSRRRAKATLLKEGYSKEQADAILLKWGYQSTPIRKSKGA